MTVRSRRSHWALVVCGVLVAGQALFVSAPVSTTSAASATTCAELRAWAQQTYAGTSPSLDEVATFDRAHRVAIFNAIQPATRAALWQEQMRRFDRQEGLSAEQHALIAEARTLLTPELYRKDAAAVAAFDGYWSRADRAFTEPAQRRAMFDIGAVAIAANAAPQVVPASMSVSAKAWDKLTSAFRANAGTASCECSTVFQDCVGGCSGAGSCTASLGCGPGGSSTCNGLCGGAKSR